MIGIWGGPRREYAAIKFFLYTLVGSVLMLLAILMLYFTSDLKLLSDEQLVAVHAVSPFMDAATIRSLPGPQHTFNLLAALPPLDNFQNHHLQQAQILGLSLETWAFLLLLIGFAIKVPIVPFHTWLPDAHVERRRRFQ